jgi:Holliday junction resolvase-like predicted endonuclease
MQLAPVSSTLDTLVNDPNRDAVQARLDALGFEVRSIPETTKSRQPDLLAQAEGTTMYVEVKTRSEDRVLRGRMEAVGIGKTDEIVTDLDKHNSISAEVKHASSQLCAAASQQDFRLLWYRADRGLFVSNTKEQIVSTLYGMRMVLAERPPFGLRPWYCAFAGHADFFRFREIDGVIIEADGLISLFLNPFSPRKGAFMTSRIARLLGADDAVFNIQRELDEGKLFAADGDAPRRNDPELLAHLTVKYPGIKFIRFLRGVSVTVMTTIDWSKGVSNKE